MTDEELVKIAHERFTLALEEARENREKFIEDLKFYAGEQWPDRVRRDREIQDRPVLTINRLPMFVRQVTNDQRINRPAIKVKPVDSGADIDTAEVLSGMIRHIERNSNADLAYDNAFFYAVTGSFGFFRIVTDYCDDASFEQEILIRPIVNSLTVYYDHEAHSLDGSTWRYAFVTEEMPKAEFEKQYPGKLGGWDQSTGDTQTWVMAESVRLAEYWWVTEEERTLLQLEDGTVITEDEYAKLPEEARAEPAERRTAMMRAVKWAKIGGNEVLERGDWAGKWIPIVPVFGDMIFLEGKMTLFSLIRFAKDAQRMLNYYRSTETELLALQPKAPYIAAEGQIEGYEEIWAKANRENYSVLPYKATTVAGLAVPAPQRQAFASPPTGVLQGAENAQRDMMATTGIYESSLGMKSNEQSGRAIMARQREGDVSTYHFIDNMTRAITHAGRILVDLIPKIYDTPRVVRILGEDGAEEMVRVNQPFTDRDEYGRAIEKIYDVTTGRYDVVVEAGASFSTRREEAAASMMEIVKTNPQIMGVAGDLIVKAMDWPGAEQLAERLAMTLPPNLQKPKEGEPQMPPEVQAQLQQSQQMIQQLDQTIQAMSAELEKKDLEMRRLEIEQFNAQTNRLKVQGELELKVEEMFKTKEQDSTEMDKAELEAQVKLVTLEKTLEANRELKAIELRAEMLKERMARGLIEMDIHGELMPGETLRQMMQEMAALRRSVTGTREIVRDEAGRAIGLRPVDDGTEEETGTETPLAELEDVIRDLAELRSMLAAPKEIVRDESGRAIGVRLAQMNQEQGESNGD